MGRRFGPFRRVAWSDGPTRASLWLGLAMAFGLVASLPAAAQTINDRFASGASNSGKDRLLVQAQEMVFDQNKNTVEARGQVQLYYQGRALQADRVVYDRDRNRVYAQGHAKLTETDGTVSYAERFELTEDFKDGFIDSLRSDTADRTHLTAARAERTAGNTTVLERGTYTACPTCEKHPEKPPLWQIRAKRIIHNNDEQMVYFEDATFELLGVPIAYLPYMSMADPSVKRKSGVLQPTYTAGNHVGLGVGVPIFWALAPNYDLTVTPTIYTTQGLFLQGEWRHQLVNGAYNVRLSGIFQKDPSIFDPAPFGPGNRTFRGSVESAGQFYITDKWKFGWDVNVFSDKWFLQDYRLPTTSLTSAFFREATSTAYLVGQGDRGYFDLRGYYFQGMSSYDLQSQQPVIGPVWDYNKTIDIRPEKTAGIGGQVEIDANLTHVNRELAAYQSSVATTFDNAYNLYNVCTNPPSTVSVYTRQNCRVQGIGGDFTRTTLNLSWQRKFIDPLGEVWTPFVFARANGALLTLNQSNSQTFSLGTPATTSIIPNSAQSNWFGQDANSWSGLAVPGVGLEYRYPFMMANEWATHVFEPIAQVIVRPNEPTTQSMVNEDSQSLVFDDTNLFMWNKYSGYDRFEGGTRLNYGGQYTMTFQKGGYANLAIGQSFQLAGRNSYATPDAANIGLSSGLDTRSSDIVSRFAFAPNSMISFIAKGRFDSLNYGVRRFDLTTVGHLGDFEASVQYARYEAQPEIGYYKRREGLSTSLRYKFDKNYFMSGNVVFDLSRHLYNNDPQIAGNAPLFSVAGLGVGAGYSDDCATIAVNYSSVYQNNGSGALVRNQTVSFQLQLRTLGETKVQNSLSDIRVQDGIGGAR